MAKLSLDAIHFSYGDRPALLDISLSPQAGELWGLIGPNSAGKSTLLHVMSGALRPQRGSVQLEGQALKTFDRRAIARKIAMVSSEDHFAFPFTVEQIVLMGRLPHLARWQRESENDRQIAGQAMAETDVLSLRDRSVQQLSSGERQRVLLARALAQEPEILLLDEPSAHLDIGHEWGLFDLLEARRRTGLTIVCAIHNLSMAARYAQRLVLLSAGRLLAVDTPQIVLQPQHLHASFGVSAQIQWAGPDARELLLLPTKGNCR